MDGGPVTANGQETTEERMDRLEAKAAWLSELAERIVERVRNGATR